MLARTHRLPTPLCTRTLKEGKRVHSAHLTAVFSPADTPKEWRCAVVVGKKAEKSAVGRNLLTRRVYEIVWQHRSLLAGKWVVLLLRTGCTPLPFATLEREVKEVLERIGV